MTDYKMYNHPSYAMSKHQMTSRQPTNPADELSTANGIPG
ncbi:predicted protein [Botrytis cinerea T4]|uniref:Uncharacterized protein n=1 Tax=Botryotinia fuckeliana (strain T4) TaxID=999810 RepID=G2YI16_BOTF4|nr:predicted protein [Botrytis cinerea T4]